MSNNVILLIDASSLLYRAYHGIPAVKNSAGLDIAAISGFMSIMVKVIKKFKDCSPIVVFDAEGKNFRHEKFPAYKAERKPMPDELKEQLGYIVSALEQSQFATLQIHGVEADDTIGTLAKRYSGLGYDVVIASPDKDMAQLISNKVKIYKPKPKVFWDADSVLDEMGVFPSQIVDYMALVGDGTDGFSGAEGVGGVTASKLLQRYGTIKGVLEAGDDIANLDLRGAKSLYAKLQNQVDNIRMSYFLAKIQCEVSIPRSLDEMATAQYDLPALQAICDEIEVKVKI